MKARIRYPVGTILMAVLAATTLTGCGNTEESTEISLMSTRLQAVDESLATKNFTKARADLASLTAQAKAALTAGELTTAEADRILAAITTLLAALPAAARPAATPPPSPSTPQQGALKTKGPSKPQNQGKGSDRSNGHGNSGKGSKN